MELPTPADPYPRQHEMRLEETYPSGAQEWFCPICTRRFVVQMQPVFNIIDLEAGNTQVSHIGSTIENLSIGLDLVGTREEPVLSDELRALVEKALKDVDFDDW